MFKLSPFTIDLRQRNTVAKKGLWLLLFLLHTTILQAQLINTGWVYGGSGNHMLYNCYIDKEGNRYQVFAFNTAFNVDSLGTPVSIIPNSYGGIWNQNSLSIVKFDTAGNYVYQLRLESPLGIGADYVTLAFNSNNEVYLSCCFVQKDSINLYDAQGVLYQQVKPGFKGSGNFTQSSYATMLCKLSPNGQFQWVNTVSRSTLPNLLFGAQLHGLTVNSNDEVTMNFVCFRSPYSNAADTLLIKHSTGSTDSVMVQTELSLLRFSAAGALVSAFQPEKNRFQVAHADSFYHKFYWAQQGGAYTYCIFNVDLTADDTFKCAQPLALKAGNNFIMLKLDANDSVVWAKCVVRTLIQYLPNFSMDFDPDKQELSLATMYDNSRFYLGLNPSFSSSSTGSYLCRLTPAGNLVRGDLFPDVWTKSFAYNKVSKQYMLIGSLIGSNTQLQPFVPSSNPNAKPIMFAASLDSLHNIYFAQPIISAPNYMSSTIGMHFWKPGYPIIDPKGRTFIAGWFADSIQLHCNKLKATVHFNNFGNPLYDGFLLMLGVHIPVDTTMCRSMTSPSGRFTWNTAGYHYDTIPNSLGCDSAILYHVKTLQTKKTIDTAVCKTMLSPSGKYTWTGNGTFTDTIPNAANCDSILTIRLTILQSTQTIDTSVQVTYTSPSGKYTWDSSGTYRDTLQSSMGCDSMFLIRVTVLQKKIFLDTAVCNSLVSPSGNFLYTLPGTYVDTVPNTAGGKTIYTISLKILHSQHNFDTTYCGSYVSPSGKYTWNVTGYYLDTIPNVYNCDSVLTIHFIKTETTDTLYATNCDSLVSPSGKYVYTLSGWYTDTIPTQQQCDSIIFISYNRPATFGTLTQTVCDSLLSPSTRYVYRTAGTYRDTIPNQAGCDSIITIQLTITPITISVFKTNDISCEYPTSVLSVSGANISTYTWQPATALSDIHAASPVASPLTKTMYYVTVQDTKGCIALDSLELNVDLQDSIRQPANVFTPNRDGYNDCFTIRTIARFKEVHFTIYNRWGQLVFETKGPADCWDGTLASGKEATDGTYFYLLNGITECGQKIEKQGTITLIR